MAVRIFFLSFATNLVGDCLTNLVYLLWKSRGFSLDQELGDLLLIQTWCLSQKLAFIRQVSVESDVEVGTSLVLKSFESVLLQGDQARIVLLSVGANLLVAAALYLLRNELPVLAVLVLQLQEK